MILTDTTIALDDRDLSGDSNQVTLEFSRDDLDGTTFRAGGKVHKAGMSDVTASVSGFWTAETDEQIDSLAGASGKLVIASAAHVGSPAFMFDAKVLSESKGGSIGELIPWSASFGNASRTGAVRGVVLHDPSSAVDATGPSSGVQLGSLGAGEYVDFYVHVFEVNAATPVLELEFQNSTTNGWSMPVTAETESFDPGDVQVIRVEGPVTNSWWRVNVSAVSGDATFLVTAATNS